ncbi:MAG: type I methionyl aminopeptidase [bacterium]|nr:type I methionyl aminopeptidase [bacterium]
MTSRLKTPEEIKILKEGGQRLAEILALLASKVKPGISTLLLEEEAMRLIKEGGDKPAFLGYRPQGAKRPFPASLCVSINEEIVHGIPNEIEKIIKEGDIVSLDFGIVHRGLITDAAVTVPAGTIDEESRKLIEVTREALASGIKAALPGSTIGDIGAAISRVVRASGFTLADDLVGHGVGYAVHEDPFVPNVGIEGKGERLVPGLVIALEPMVNVGKSGIKVLPDGYTIVTRDGSRSAHFEHSIAITEKGNIILTSNE